MDAAHINPGELSRKVRGNNNLAVARLKPGVTVEEAQSEMNAIAARIAAADPQNVLTRSDRGADARRRARPMSAALCT